MKMNKPITSTPSMTNDTLKGLNIKFICICDVLTLLVIGKSSKYLEYMLLYAKFPCRV